MANLSNINNKFLFTDGDFLKIGNLAPINNISGTESGISVTNSNVASITLDNTAASGKRYVMYSSGNGSLVFWDDDATSARLQIDTSGNSTFSGDIMPNAENLYDIGSAAVRWEDVYADQVYGRDVYVDDYIYHNGDTNTYIRVQADQWTFRTGGDDRMHIDNTGVGIFTTSPQRTLDVRGTGLSIFGSGGNTELMLRGQVEGTGTVRSLGAWHWSIRPDVGGDNDDLKLLRFVTGSYQAIALQFDNTNGNATFAGKITAPTLSIQNQINTTSSNLEINYANGDGTTTNFKDFYIRDGKNAVILNIQGSSKNATFAGIIDTGGRVKVTGGSTDQYYFEGARTGVGVTYRLYDNANNIYHDSWSSQVIRLNQNGGSGGNFIITGGNVGIGVGTPGALLDVVAPNSGGAARQDMFRLLQSGQNTLSCYMYGGTTDLVQLHVSGTEQNLSLTTGGVATAATATGIHLRSGGNVGIGTLSPTAKLDINGTVRYRGNTYNQLTYQVSGNYSANTWYTIATNATLTEQGIYILVAYVEDFTAGGSNYYIYAASTNFYWDTTSTNRTTAFNFPALLGTGHATGSLPLIRITQELGTAGAQSKIQWQTPYTYTGLNPGLGGKKLIFYFKRIGG